jgi:protein TonB
MGHQGLVVVRVMIGRTGSIESARIQSSSGFDLLDDAALAAVRAVQFKPYQVNGLTKRAMADIPFNFVLRN